MATDYYWRWNHCGCCNRYTSTHMFSSGLLFRAYTREETPFPYAIHSVQDWATLTGHIPGGIFDEYGRQEDTLEFWADLQPGSTNWGEQAGMNAFQDDQGFWLTYTDFGGPHA